ncbi:hypothetical protein OG730_34690 [Streptomyces sp. NBC_01298]|uniref:hypothetical protein n=1 Tax=Streptomyces sp. NBC_01298 TaxID=2903817 RepID=UPI002E14A4ED|nr:hypothetical protein OG730_34690 [Streptomyces sp. NBC_01298]
MSIRDDILAGLRIAESGSVGDETPEQLLARYDARVLRETADWLKAVGEPQAAHLLSTLGGESRG